MRVDRPVPSEKQRMPYRVHAAFIFVFALSLSSAAAEESQSAPATSFSALHSLLAPREQLIVRDNLGKTVKGRLVAISDSSLEVARRRWNFRTERRTWTEGSVARIQRLDSTWDGGAIGGAIGVVLVVIMAKSPGCGWQCLPFAGTAVPLGFFIGGAVDGSRNATLYESPGARRSSAAPAGTVRASMAVGWPCVSPRGR